MAAKVRRGIRSTWRVSEVAVMEKNAYIMFVDIIESTRLARELGEVSYNKKLLAYRYHLRNVFCAKADPLFMSIQGDEGLLIADGDANNSVMVLACAIEVKSVLKSFMPEFEVAFGVHKGAISLFLDERKRIESINGREINLAKRIETASRKGKYSKLFISLAVHDDLATANPALRKFFDYSKHSDLKGFEGEELSLFELKQLKIRKSDEEEFPIARLSRVFPEEVLQSYREIREFTGKRECEPS
jgi:class 3 adenylate cyclase